jgi:hypothetical protein
MCSMNQRVVPRVGNGPEDFPCRRVCISHRRLNSGSVLETESYRFLVETLRPASLTEADRLSSVRLADYAVSLTQISPVYGLGSCVLSNDKMWTMFDAISQASHPHRLCT